jgi:excisionase family DNA binding protein
MNSMKADAAGVKQPRWFSVGEAARYLGISQPTIFRWMKEGLLSFYKVGGSTRFSQENLDVVIEKVTGRKEAEAVAGRCAACGHGVMIEGKLQGASRLYFRPDKTRFWTFDEALVPLAAKTCAACGYVQIHADTAKLNRLRRSEVNDDVTT